MHGRMSQSTKIKEITYCDYSTMERTFTNLYAMKFPV